MLKNWLQFARFWWAQNQPAFWRTMKPSYRAATVILALVVVWIGSGLITGTDGKPSDADAQSKSAGGIPRVGVLTLHARERAATVTVRGHTQALHAVDVRAEVEGVVQALHFEKGDRVKEGQTLCEIKLNDRGAKLDQARASVAQMEKQHDVDVKLAADGFRSKMQVAASEAALEAARAQLRTMQIQLANTQIKAPFDGIADNRFVEVGDYMRVGDKCATVIAPEPFLAVGDVSEDDVSKIETGGPASASLVTGETIEGKIRFVADRADPTTRTFRVEVELPNPDGKLRDGVSTDIRIPVAHVKADKISPGILVLDDNGVVGVRTVEHGLVKFRPVKIISDAPDGMWIAGLPDPVTVITVGQEFVSDGERVEPVPEKGGMAS
jgi:membrane fusion protein, multidrug efflux system